MVVSWISFVVPPDVIPGRMALLITLFLVLVNIFNTVTTNTPKAEGKKIEHLFYRVHNVIKGGLTTRFDPPPNGLRELELHRSSTNVCTKTEMFLKIFFDIRFRSEGA